MSQENLEIVREIYAEWQRGNMRAGVELFDPDIVLESFMPDSSERVVVQGVGELEVFMREFLAQWSDYRLVAAEFREVGRDKVLVAGHQSATGRQSGIAVEMPMFSLWTFRDGKVVRLIVDLPKKVLDAVGLRE